MKKLIGTLAALILAAGLGAAGRAADAGDPNAVLDKAVQALGGAEKLRKIRAFSWTTEGTVTFNGNEGPLIQKTLVQDLDHVRQEVQVEFGGAKYDGVTVLAGDRGWKNFQGLMEIDKGLLANEKRTIYLASLPITVLPLKGPGFKLESIPDEPVDGKPAAGLKVTPPDGQEFRLYFDKERGLPVRLVAKLLDFMGNEYTQETTFSAYREMGGILKATKIVSKRDGGKFLDQLVTEFKVVDPVDPKSFEPPQ